jgi:predicted dehydrogenase
VVISGNNSRKADYILASVKAGLNVLADKPMVVRDDEFASLEEAYRIAEEKGVLLDDIMTERYEITSILQRELSLVEPLFGELVAGSPEEPAISKASVHHFYKVVSGRPLTRPTWFFDVSQQGEGVVDVTTHLVDLVHWQCFPGEAVDYRSEIEVLAAGRWPTPLTPEQFERVTTFWRSTKRSRCITAAVRNGPRFRRSFCDARRHMIANSEFLRSVTSMQPG